MLQTRIHTKVVLMILALYIDITYDIYNRLYALKLLLTHTVLAQIMDYQEDFHLIIFVNLSSRHLSFFFLPNV